MRWGVLGTGYWAVEVHGKGLAEHPDAELAGIWGRDPDKAATAAATLGTEPVADLDELLSTVDAVSIAVPPDVQAELAVRAATNGCHLLLDKPLALSVEAADRVVTAVARHGVRSVVFFTTRFQPNVAEFLTGAAGQEWHGVRATMFASIFQPGNPYGASPWRREHGGLWDVAPHVLAVVLPMLGPVAGVTAIDGPRDTTYLLLRHTHGGVSQVAITLDAPAALVMNEFLCYGPDGFVAVPRGSLTSVEAFHHAIESIERGTGHPCDARFGRDVVAILAAAARSRETGRAETP